MSKKIYAIRDNKIGSFAPPCLFDNDATAIRAFGDLVSRDKDSLMYLHPEDFSLWSLGEFETENGSIVQTTEFFRTLANASDFVRDKE